MFSQHESDRDALPKGGQTRHGSTRFKAFFATTLLATLLAATAFQRVVSADALLPVTATALFGMATVIAGLAVLSERRSRLRLAALDAAGVVAAVGIAVSILIEPDQVVRLISPSFRIGIISTARQITPQLQAGPLWQFFGIVMSD